VFDIACVCMWVFIDRLMLASQVKGWRDIIKSAAMAEYQFYNSGCV